MRQLILATCGWLFFGPAYANHLEPDANGYVSQYEVHLDYPSPTDGASCTGGSAVNSNASDEYIIRDNAGWGEINNATYQFFFACPGDYRTAGGHTITTDGTQANPHWIVALDDTGAVETAHPFDLAAADRVRVDSILIDDTSWWIITGLSVEGGQRGVELEHEFSTTGDSPDNIIDRLYIHDMDAYVGATGGVEMGSGSDRSVVQNTFIGPCKVETNVDWNGVRVREGDDHRVVSNEIVNCSDAIVFSSNVGVPTNDGAVVENNDLYLTPAIYSDCDGNLDPDGPCACAENGIDFKGGAGSSAEAIHVIHNRFWGWRPGDDACGGTGSPNGAAIVPQDDGSFILIERNIVTDVGVGYASAPTATTNITVQGNLFHDINTNQPVSVKAIGLNNNINARALGNTVSNAASWINYSGDHEVACNLVINSGDVIGTNDGITSHNVFVNTTAAGTNTDTYASAVAADLTDYTFNRRLISGPEQVTITDVQPTAGSGFLDHCSTYNLQTGYGVDG